MTPAERQLLVTALMGLRLLGAEMAKLHQESGACLVTAENLLNRVESLLKEPNERP